MAKAPSTVTVGAKCPRCEQTVEVTLTVAVRMVPPVPMNPKFPADAEVVLTDVQPGFHHDCPGRPE